MFRDDSKEDSAFRAEVRGWLEANLPRSLRGRTARPHPPEIMPWYFKLRDRGWLAPQWPKQYGGMGATLTQQIILSEELARISAPAIPSQGINHLGPILMKYGDAGAEGDAPSADPQRRRDLGAGLLGAGCGLRSRQPDHQGRVEGRPVHRQRPQDLADLGPLRRLDVHAGAHRSQRGGEAGRNQLHPGRPEDAWHQGAADHQHRRRRRVRRVHAGRRRSAGGKSRRQTARRLGRRQRSARARAAIDVEPAVHRGRDRADQEDRGGDRCRP